MNEHVVLIDCDNKPLGTADKYDVHNGDTPLHRGFSLFIINSSGELLLQKRSKFKKTWPNVWSNTVCGHPAIDESPQAAAVRRAKYELGIDLELDDINLLIDDYRYRYEHLDVVENEICPVMVVFKDVQPKLNPKEVASTRWVKWSGFLDEISNPNQYSQWCQEEAKLLNANQSFKRMLEQNTR